MYSVLVVSAVLVHVACTTSLYLPPTPSMDGSTGTCRTPYDQFDGNCIPTSACTGGQFSGLCTGASSIKCCAAETRPATTYTDVAITKEAWRELFSGVQGDRSDALYPYFREALRVAEINTCLRVASFVAQLGHESVGLRYFEEIASGAAYEGRTDLGNTQPGDGKRYKGRGPIQLTGRSNYRSAGIALGLPLEESPELVTFPSAGFKVASHYWNTRRLNRYTDSGSYEDFKILTKRINGGYNGLTDRTNRWHEARRQLGCAPLRDGCTKGQAGFCIDTNTEECDGADVKSGFCSGAGNIQCCPTSKVKGENVGATLFPKPVTQAPRETEEVGEWIQCKCDGADVKSGFCSGANNIQCCPTGRVKANDSRDSCSNGQAGFCIDTDAEECDGADVKSGFCSGANNIKCCPTGRVKANDSRDSCNNGQAGFCIDTDAEECDGADVKSGFCSGANNIKCCPTGRVKANDSRDSCNNGQAGFCIDTDAEECDGADVKSGFCSGANNIQCCPTGKVKGGDRHRRRSRREDERTAGVCINTNIYDCTSGETVAGLCPGSSKIRCCLMDSGVVTKLDEYARGEYDEDPCSDAGGICTHPDNCGLGKAMQEITVFAQPSMMCDNISPALTCCVDSLSYVPPPPPPTPTPAPAAQTETCSTAGGKCFNPSFQSCKGAQAEPGSCTVSTMDILLGQTSCCPAGGTVEEDAFVVTPAPDSTTTEAAIVESEFTRPVALGTRISSPFGMRSSGMHWGTDYAVPIGTNVYAVHAGTIKNVLNNAGGCGRMIGIYWGSNGEHAEYCHLSAHKVTEGTLVEPGDLIALSGNTGRSTGPHLHIEYNNGSGYVYPPWEEPIDPDACTNGQAGVCIDVYDRVCVGASTLTGFCPGASNIQCCPSGTHTNKAAAIASGLIDRSTSISTAPTTTSFDASGGGAGSVGATFATTTVPNSSQHAHIAADAVSTAAPEASTRPTNGGNNSAVAESTSTDENESEMATENKLGGGGAAAIAISVLIVALGTYMYVDRWRKGNSPAGGNAAGSTVNIKMDMLISNGASINTTGTLVSIGENYEPMDQIPASQLGKLASNQQQQQQQQRVLLVDGEENDGGKRGRTNTVTYQIPVSDSWQSNAAPKGARVAITSFNKGSDIHGSAASAAAMAAATVDGGGGLGSFNHTVSNLRAASGPAISSSGASNITRSGRQGSGAYGFEGNGNGSKSANGYENGNGGGGNANSDGVVYATYAPADEYHDNIGAFNGYSSAFNSSAPGGGGGGGGVTNNRKPGESGAGASSTYGPAVGPRGVKVRSARQGSGAYGFAEEED
eukprot:gene5196-9091_t